MQGGLGQRVIFEALVLLCAASFVLVLLLGFFHWRGMEQAVQEAKIQAKLEADRGAGQIDAQLRDFTRLAHAIAHDLSSGKLKDEQLLDTLKDTIETYPRLLQIGVAYAPFAYDPQVRLYAPSYLQTDGEPQLDRIELFRDYTNEEWYKQAMAQGPVWIEPSFREASNTLMASFSVPFDRPETPGQNRAPAGVVHITLSVDAIKDLVDALNLGTTGFGFILSKQGRALVYPIPEYVRWGKTIFDLGHEGHDSAVRAVGEKMIRGESGVIDHGDAGTGLSSWIFYSPILTTGWSMGVVYIKPELPLSPTTIRRERMQIVMGLIAFLLLLSALIFRVDRGRITRLWRVAFSISCVFVAGIGGMWYLEITVPDPDSEMEVKILDKASVNTFMASMDRAAHTLNIENPMYIPTGVFVQSIEFLGANNVVVTGYIWQRYANGIEAGVSRGFSLPELRSGDITEAYRQQDKNGEVIGWRIRVTLRERFSYLQYPFDRENIWIRLWPQDFYRNVILIPDLQAYRLINPSFRPGLAENIVLPGWTIESSFFGYKHNSYDTNFGIENNVWLEKVPDLYFNVIVARNILNPFISKIVPMTVVAWMLFSMIVIASNERERHWLLNFNSLGVMTSCAALFFVIIFSQIDLREKIASDNIVYLEYFSFVMYLAILAVIINAIVFAKGHNFSFIQYQDNLIPKLLYWPVILASLLGITFFVFYFY